MKCNLDNLDRLRQDVFTANLRLVSAGLVVNTWGNASGIDREKGIVLIKPSGVSYDLLKPDDIAAVSLHGDSIDSRLRPSSDLQTHLAIYRAFPHVGGVVHTHSIHATVFAQACLPLPCLGTTHADHFHGPIPVTRTLREDEIRDEYERHTGDVIVETFPGDLAARVPAVLVAQHGPFTWGPTVSDAVVNSIVLETVAKMAMLTKTLNPEIGPIDSCLLDRHYLRKHGTGAYYGQAVPR